MLEKDQVETISSEAPLNWGTFNDHHRRVSRVQVDRNGRHPGYIAIIILEQKQDAALYLDEDMICSHRRLCAGV
jgi:hypothetical protein